MNVLINGEKVHTQSFLFSGGEVQTKLDLGNMQWEDKIFIQAKLQSSNDIIELLQLNDILKRQFPYADRCLSIPYAPYARQDRVCAKGESLAAKVFADLINTCGFKRVIVVDCHSDVLAGMINNCVNIPVSQVLSNNGCLDTSLKISHGFIVSPDAGANKKVFSLCQNYPLQTFVRADKVRDPATGQISGTEVYYDDFEGKPVLIVDDICDKGGTFILLAKKLKEKGAGKITLFVTHGIFGNGIEVFDNLIDEVWTTDSLDFGVQHEKLHKIKL